MDDIQYSLKSEREPENEMIYFMKWLNQELSVLKTEAQNAH